MRKLLFTFVLSNSFLSFSQNYTPFPDSGAVWVNVHYTYVWGEFEFPDEELTGLANWTVDGSDTIISAITYSKMKLTNGDYQGAIRDSGGQIYFVPKDSLNEYLVYDFTVNEGDILTDVYIHSLCNVPLLMDCEVTNIDSIMINGDYRTTVETDYGGFWIEGIGCDQGLFAETWDNVSGYMLNLYCMSHNGNILYPNEGSGSCPLDVSVSELKNEDVLYVFPNPTAGGLTITWQQNEPIQQVFITNQLGEIIAATLIKTKNQIEVDLSTFPDGIYFISVTTGNRQVVQKIIKQ